jgi:hypothetical protein
MKGANIQLVKYDFLLPRLGAYYTPRYEAISLGVEWWPAPSSAHAALPMDFSYPDFLKLLSLALSLPNARQVQ